MISENLKKMMDTRGYNLTQLSKISGVKIAHLSQIKNGGNLSIKILLQIADALHCSTDYLLGREVI